MFSLLTLCLRCCIKSFSVEDCYRSSAVCRCVGDKAGISVGIFNFCKLLQVSSEVEEVDEDGERAVYNLIQQH